MLRKLFNHIFYLLILVFLSSCGDSDVIVENLQISGLQFSSNLALPPGQFDRVLVTQTTEVQIIVANVGDADAENISYDLAANPRISYTGGVFPGANGNCNSTLASGESCILEFIFSPTTGFPVNTNLAVSFTDRFQTQSIDIALQGEGSTPASLAFDITSHDFNQVAFDSVVPTSAVGNLTLTVTNSGEWEATDTSFINPGSPFFIANNNCGVQINEAESCTVDIEFRPAALGSFAYNALGPSPLDTYALGLDYNNGLATPGTTNFSILSIFEGEGIAAALLTLTAIPDAFDVGSVITGFSDTSTFTLTNSGSIDAVIDQTLTNNLIAPFSFEGGSYPGTGGTCLNTNTSGDFIIAPTEVCRICLLYTSPSPRDQRGSRMPSSA